MVKRLSFAEKTVTEKEKEEEEMRRKKLEEIEEEEDDNGDEEEIEEGEEEIDYDDDDDEMDEEDDDEDMDFDDLDEVDLDNLDDDALAFYEKKLEAKLNKEIEQERKKLVAKGPKKSEGDEDDDEEKAKKKEEKKEASKKVLKPISKKDLEKYNKEQDQHGIIYLSRIPPGMTPQKVKQIMTGFGKVERIYLTPESKEARKIRRKEYGKSGGKRFTDGWVEFADKKIAKAVAFSLNGTPIGGRNRCIYAQDLWLIKYLPKFKWSDLTEKLAQESEMRHQRLKVALARAKRQNELVLERISQAKGKEIYERKKQKKLEKKAGIGKIEKELKKNPGNSEKKTTNPNFRHL